MVAGVVWKNYQQSNICFGSNRNTDNSNACFKATTSSWWAFFVTSQTYAGMSKSEFHFHFAMLYSHIFIYNQFNNIDREKTLY